MTACYSRLTCSNVFGRMLLFLFLMGLFPPVGLLPVDARRDAFFAKNVCAQTPATFSHALLQQPTSSQESHLLPANAPWEGRRTRIETLRVQEEYADQNLVAREWLPRRPTLQIGSFAQKGGNNREIASLLHPRPTEVYKLYSAGEWRDSAVSFFGATTLTYADYGMRRWTKLVTPHLFYPYLALDSTEGRPRTVTGMVSLGRLQRMEFSTFALSVTYCGERNRVEGALEHRFAQHQLTLREGVAIPVGEYWLSQWGRFEYLSQRDRATAQTPVRLFRHIGFGLWDLDRTTAETRMDFQASSGMVQCGLQFLPKLGEGWLASVNAAHRWGTTGDVRQRSVASFVLQELNLLLGYDYVAGGERAQCALDASWQNRTGVEQFYDSVGRRGNKKYQLLFSEPTYKGRYRAYGARLVYITEHLPWEIGVRLWGGYLTQASEYVRPYSYSLLQRWKIETTVHLSWRHTQHRLTCRSAWGIFTRANERRELYPHIREPLRSEFLYPELARRLPLQYHFLVTLAYAYAFPNGWTLELAPELGYFRTESASQWQGGVTLVVGK